MLAKKNFAFLIHAPQGGLIVAPVLFDEGPLSRSDPLSGQSESWPDRGAPDRSTARWLVERWEALRLALGAHGALPCEVGTLIPPQGCPLAPWRLPPLHPLAPFARDCAKLGRMAPRERKVWLFESTD